MRAVDLSGIAGRRIKCANLEIRFLRGFDFDSHRGRCRRENRGTVGTGLRKLAAQGKRRVKKQKRGVGAIELAVEIMQTREDGQFVVKQGLLQPRFKELE